MGKSNIVKEVDNLKDKRDSFGVNSAENSFKQTLRSKVKKDDNKFDLISNLPLKTSNENSPSKTNVIFSNFKSETKLNNHICDDHKDGFSIKAFSVKEYGYAENQNENFRSYMEDYFRVIDKFMGDKTKGLFALFDGHGGSDVAKFVRDNFPDQFSYCLYNTKSNIQQSFINAFSKIDEDISKKGFSENMGSTACVAYITQENNLISGMQKVVYCANIGDTRAYIVSKNCIKRLTVDHKCTVKEEQTRIKNAGGVIMDGRIFGQLILSRALGDFALKDCGVTSVPHISKHLVNDSDIFMVIASDGVWDTVTEVDLLELCKENFNFGSGKLSELIVNSALEKGSQDNISCLIIKLN